MSVQQTIDFNPMPGRVKIAALLEAKLRDNEKSQKELADAAGLAPSAITALLQKERNVTVPVAAKLGGVEWLGISAPELLTAALGEDD